MKKKVAEYRKRFREVLLTDGKPAFTEREYKERVQVHYRTLHKYISLFGNYLSDYMESNIIRKWLCTIILGRKRCRQITTSKSKTKFITINEVYKLFRYVPAKHLFSIYLQRKTHFSYSIGQPISPVYFKGWKDEEEQRRKNISMKFAEFIYIILCEYIVLHNYHWCGGLMHKDIKTIDKWMVKI